MPRLAVLALVAVTAYGGDVVDVQEIVERATGAMQADWAAAPAFAFVQRDAVTSKGNITSKTQQVFMIAGSDYYMPIAINDAPLPPDQQKAQVEKLRREIERRSHETPEQAQKRTEQYRKMRQQNGILISQFTKAFEFTLAGEETVDGRPAYILEAHPNPAYHPPNRTARILAGMQGRLWVDRESFHWIKAQAEATKSISVFGFFAHVLPGSRMELEMEPISESVWLLKRFAVDLRVAILWLKSTKSTETTFSRYEPAAAALKQWLALRFLAGGLHNRSL